jgi:hypothetical protein
MALKKIEHVAPKKAFMTLDDLAAFVHDAKRSGAAGQEIVEGTVSFGGKLQKLAVEVQATNPTSLDKPQTT